jgi:hypothetical protein
MEAKDVVLDAFSRVRDVAHKAVEGLSVDELAFRIDAESNTIAWLVWHLTRIQDDHIADVANIEQVWTSGGWAKRFGLPFDERTTGYGQTSADVATLRADASLLLGYLDATSAATQAYVSKLSPDDFERVVDENWDPPVTLAVRLVSVIGDDLQHAGQAAFIRGIAERRR